MPKMTYAQHPVHPMLNDIPSALVPASLALDMLHLVTRRGTFRNASYLSLAAAFAAGIPAAVSGYRDYVELPDASDVKRTANAHAILNAGVLGAVGLGLAMRSFGRVGLGARVLNIAANGALLAGSWYGGRLVFEHGVRVAGVDPIADAPEHGEDMGRRYADRLAAYEQAMPSSSLSGLVDRAGETAEHLGAEARVKADAAAGVARERAAQAQEVLDTAKAKARDAGLPGTGRDAHGDDGPADDTDRDAMGGDVRRRADASGTTGPGNLASAGGQRDAGAAHEADAAGAGAIGDDPLLDVAASRRATGDEA